MQKVGRMSVPFRANGMKKDASADEKESDKNDEENENKNEKDFLYHVCNYSTQRLISHSHTHSLQCRSD